MKQTNSQSRYSHMIEIFGDSFENIQKSRILVVGAGGIGCELLKVIFFKFSKFSKNLVLSGFESIEIVCLNYILNQRLTWTPLTSPI
jgi:tRNA A37 threonylcarbamoyladenosine dehydratase